MTTAVQLRAANGQWVGAVHGGGANVVADRPVPAVAETFSVVPVQGGLLAHGALIAVQVSNGQFWCAEGGGGGALTANRAYRKEWETFTLERVAGPGALASGDAVAFKALNGQYVCAEGGGGRELVANRPALGPWETFTATVLPPRRVRVELDSVRCADTEDVTGADEFYAAGAGVDRFSGAAQTVLCKPFAVNDRQTKAFPMASGERVVFEGTVDAASSIGIGLKFFDEDANRDWTKYGAMAGELGNKVSAGVALLPAYGKAAGAVLTVLTQAAGLIMSLDQDDLLGDVTLDLPVSALPMGTSVRSLNVRGGGGWWSSWSYVVQLRTTVN